MKKLLGILFSIYLSLMPVLALELDMSVDEEIRKKYNTNQLQYDVLPELPKVSPTQGQNTNTNKAPAQTPVYTQNQPNVTAVDPKSGIKIPSGTKFQVKSNLTISDSQKSGTVVSFNSYAPVYKSGITIPTGTKFYAIIEESHRPQITGNGGLVVIRVTSMTFGGKTYQINAKITKANSKKIFFNNIKGQRQYWKGVAKQIDKGENFYKKTRRASAKLADNPIGIIIASVPTVAGIAGYAVTTVISPVSGLFSKGKSLSIPSGSTFEIKLLDNAYVN